MMMSGKPSQFTSPTILTDRFTESNPIDDPNLSPLATDSADTVLLPDTRKEMSVGSSFNSMSLKTFPRAPLDTVRNGNTILKVKSKDPITDID